MAQKQVATLQEFNRIVETDSMGMVSASGCSHKNDHSKQCLNRLHDIHNQPLRDHYVNQLKKKYGGDIRARLKARCNNTFPVSNVTDRK